LQLVEQEKMKKTKLQQTLMANLLQMAKEGLRTASYWFRMGLIKMKRPSARVKTQLLSFQVWWRVVG